MQSRLDDLKASGDSPNDKKVETKVEMVKLEIERGKSEVDESLAPFAAVMAGIQKIEKHVETINLLKQRSKQEVKDDAQRKIMEDLERTMIASKREARTVKSELDRIAAENAKLEDQGSTTAQIRKNLLNTHARHFQEVVIEYQTAGDAFRESLKERIARQARIVKEDITEDQIEELMNSPSPGAIFQSAVVRLDDRMIDVVHEIEDRHKGMLAIEQGVKEIQELFQDMACLVDLQQETLDVIEKNVLDASKNTKEGEKNMIKAEKHSKNARKAQCWILFIIAVVAILIVVFVILVKH
ncbi:t-SNARE coiled-coil homology domain-containing protein [Plasmodiophora brassicae]|uniref:t-SNARE coiled-coil homology domain-containing protein n=2 Tax=Plasmodiophora brassicae TaxID=37360 RepID=A0A3P3YBG2_PLABS|nr:unnamed protein product [Plasmodiophora brassicae]